MIGDDFAGIISLREGAKIIWHLDVSAPARVEQILQAETREMSFDFLVVVVRSRRRGSAVPVLVLVLEIVIDINHCTGVIREHRARSHIENVASASAAPSIVGNYERYQRG